MAAASSGNQSSPRGRIIINRDETGINFTQPPLSALQDPAVTPSAYKALSILYWYEHRLGYYPGHITAAAEFCWGRSALCAALRQLKTSGWLRMTQHGRGATCDMVIPDPQRKLPCTGESWRPGNETPESSWRPENRTPADPGVRDPGRFSISDPNREREYPTRAGARGPEFINELGEPRGTDPEMHMTPEQTRRWSDAVADLQTYCQAHPDDSEAYEVWVAVAAGSTVQERLAALEAAAPYLHRARAQKRVVARVPAGGGDRG